jgi:hypothetical protein
LGIWSRDTILAKYIQFDERAVGIQCTIVAARTIQPICGNKQRYRQSKGKQSVEMAREGRHVLRLRHSFHRSISHPKRYHIGFTENIDQRFKELSKRE